MTQPRGYFQGKTIAELSRQVRNQEISCVALTQAALGAILQMNPATNAFVSLHANEAFRTAELLDREIAAGKYRGPLHGIPVAIKDNIDTQGMPTTYGSHLFQNHQPTADAHCVALLRQAGAVIVGKTLTSEFALGPTGEFSFQGASHNPHDLARVTGGSSAGSAAAVATGMVPIAMGTDTAGSIRIPASFCGVVGFKPSYGRISMEGIYPVSATLDHVGPLAQCVEDDCHRAGGAQCLAKLHGEASPCASGRLGGSQADPRCGRSRTCLLPCTFPRTVWRRAKCR